MQANRKFIQEDTINYINNVIYAGSFPYSKIDCRRDTRLVVDSIAFDLLSRLGFAPFAYTRSVISAYLFDAISGILLCV